MGATAHYRSITPWALDLLKAHPWLVEPFVCWQRYDRRISPWLDTLPEEKREALVARITESLDGENAALVMWERREPEDFARVRPELQRLQAEWESPSLTIDKTWRGRVQGGFSSLSRASQLIRSVDTRSTGSDKSMTDEAVGRVKALLETLPGVRVAWSEVAMPTGNARFGMEVGDLRTLSRLAHLATSHNFWLVAEVDWSCRPMSVHDDPSCIRYHLRVSTLPRIDEPSELHDLARALHREIELLGRRSG